MKDNASRIMNIALIGPNGCGKTEALEAALPSLGRVNFYTYPQFGYNVHDLLIGETRVNLYDIMGSGPAGELSSAYTGLDGAVIFRSFVSSINYSDLVRNQSPGLLIQHFNRGDSLDLHIQKIVKCTLDNPKPPKAEAQKPSEIWCLFTDPGNPEEESLAYDTIEGAHAEIERHFMSRVRYGATKYHGFRTNSGDNHVFVTREACIASIIQHGLARIEKATLHNE